MTLITMNELLEAMKCISMHKADAGEIKLDRDLKIHKPFPGKKEKY